MRKELMGWLATFGVAALSIASLTFWWKYDLAVYPLPVRYTALVLALVALIAMMVYDWSTDTAD